MAENEIPEPPDWSDARTFFLEPDLWHEPYELDASESHHLTRVLRIREGEEVRVLDGRGREGRFPGFALQEKRQGRGPAASRRVDVFRTGIEGHPCGGLDKSRAPGLDFGEGRGV